MRSTLLIGFAAAVLTIGTAPALAATGGAAKAAEAKSGAKEEKKVCKRLKVSGSRMAEKVCLTKAQWEKVEAEI